MVKVVDSHCLLLEELSHTDLINQPAFLFCLVDYITRLAVPDQKGRGGVVHTHILRYSHTAGVGVAVKAAVTACVVGADVRRKTAGTLPAGNTPACFGPFMNILKLLLGEFLECF